MKQAIITYLRTSALRDVILLLGLFLLAKGLHGFDGRVMEIAIGILLITGGALSYLR